ncbi:MAG TPA: 3-oxoacid CoA-transferase subunit B [Caldisericia bacterium]|nr:3-oxoacid CoA-transferase subunit B [Caldisericia bacterium]HRU73523.1 3-oxoacid CoA-transferase subunit B [Caldisericia bacterium]
MDPKEIIARRVAKELKDGDFVNLGIGIPTLVSNYIPKGFKIIFQGENGILGIGEVNKENPDYEITNAGNVPVKTLPYTSFFDTFLSFTMIRGGHIDVTVLGGIQVDEEGNLANWIIPQKMIAGIGGAMDLAVGSKKLIVAMEHTAKGEPKILKRCTYPLTASKKVNLIVTELAVIEVNKDGLLLKEIHPDTSVEDVINKTEAKLNISKDLKFMEI